MSSPYLSSLVHACSRRSPTYSKYGYTASPTRRFSAGYVLGRGSDRGHGRRLQRIQREREQDMDAQAAFEAADSANNDWTHLERTAGEPRQSMIHRFIVKSVQRATDTVRSIQLVPSPFGNGRFTFKYEPGQWIDLYVPGVPKPGGFTITSWPDPRSREEGISPAISLAIQRSATNPVAEWLWQEQEHKDIAGTSVRVRVGGSFTYPPKFNGGKRWDRITDVIFVCGGVGINPFMSMLQYMFHESILSPKSSKFQNVSLMYSSGATKAGNILFLRDLERMLQSISPSVQLNIGLFLTRTKELVGIDEESVELKYRRIQLSDILAKVDEKKRRSTLVYICGPQGMTDELVEMVQRESGLDDENILYEKWW